ncbi:hypothetical protein AAMO2058_001378600 [Amorphochlora amoebiformis]
MLLWFVLVVVVSVVPLPYVHVAHVNEAQVFPDVSFTRRFGELKTIFAVQRDMSVLEFWRELTKKGFQSVPVVLKKDIYSYHAVVDVQDVLNFICSELGSDVTKDQRKLQDYKSKALEKATVKDIIAHPICRKNPYHPVSENYSVLSVVELLANEHNLRRVPVVDNLQNRHLVNFVTQSSILNYMVENMGSLGDVVNKPLSECKSFYKTVHTCDETNDTAWEAFDKMAKHQVSGLAVVDTSGRLKGLLSIRDLRTIGTDVHFFWRLHEKVKDFVLKLRKISDTSIDAHLQDHRPRTIQKCIPSDTLASAMNKLKQLRLHKLILVDNNKDRNPVGVVSIRDILKEILSN